MKRLSVLFVILLSVVSVMAQNYKETNKCVDGEVVYEGDDDYYIIITQRGCTIAERYTGVLNEGDIVRGELNKYSFVYIINKETKREIKIYIEDYAVSDRESLIWMGENKHLKRRDQERFDLSN